MTCPWVKLQSSYCFDKSMPKPNDKIGPYILISKLGRGAFGVVWLAEKRSALATTKIALKLPSNEDVDLEAIRQEASLWVHASGHPNVLPIIDADIYDEQIVIVSEYAPDGTLSKWIEKHSGKAPSVQDAVRLTEGILAGLEHLHERGVIHRDLKPDNILLQRDTPRLADFGIARILKATSKSTIATGTPSYMPPEAFDGKRSERTDIWSAAVILYQLLTGRLPFPQTEITSLIGAIVTKEPEPLPDSIPLSIQRIIQRALQKNPAERFESANAMLKALRNASHTQVTSSSGQAKTEVLPQGRFELPPTILSPAYTKSNDTPPDFRPSVPSKNKSTFWIIGAVLIVLVVGVMIGINSLSNGNNTQTTASGVSDKNTTTNTVSSPATISRSDKIGVPECDDFLAKYEACLSGKVPEAARPQFKAALEQWRTSWRKAAETPETKAGLAQGCKAALEQTKLSMKSFNCEF